MNVTNFIQTGGFPLKGERLQELQTAYSIFNSLGALAGNLTIISGCELLGTTIGNGFVYIDGELLEFRVGAVTPSSTVIIIEEAVNREFENAEIKTVHTIRYATFGTAATSWLWTDFKRPIETKEIPLDLSTQLAAIANKEDKTKVAELLEAMQLTIPKIKITTGIETINAKTNGYNENDYTKNNVYVYPPAGYNMTHLAGFMPSIAEIAFSGDVNDDDTMWCKFTTDANKVTIICSNSETRRAAKVNYMSVWIKY